MKKIIIKFISILIVVILAPIFVIGLLNTKHNKKYIPNDFVANADTPTVSPSCSGGISCSSGCESASTSAGCCD